MLQRAMLPYDLFGSSGITIISCGRDINEANSARHTPSQGADSRRDVKYKKPRKSCSKA